MEEEADQACSLVPWCRGRVESVSSSTQARLLSGHTCIYAHHREAFQLLCNIANGEAKVYKRKSGTSSAVHLDLFTIIRTVQIGSPSFKSSAP